MNRIRRWFCLALAALMVFLLHPAALAEETAEPPAEATVYSYDYDLRFMINPEVFPPREKNRVRGYAELLNMLDFQGRIIWNPSTTSLDLTGSIIPVTSPSAAISFHLYGVPSILYLESPLLGDQTIYFHNDVLMEFAYKVWDNLGIKLQYPALLYPYSTEHAFSGLAKAWRKKVKTFTKSGSVSYKSLTSIATAWSKSLETDHALKYWITDLAAPLPCGELIWSEFTNLPNYLTKQVAKKEKLSIQVKKKTTTWRNSANQTLFTQKVSDQGITWSLTLPATETTTFLSSPFSRKPWMTRSVFPSPEAIPETMIPKSPIRKPSPPI